MLCTAGHWILQLWQAGHWHLSPQTSTIYARSWLCVIPSRPISPKQNACLYWEIINASCLSVCYPSRHDGPCGAGRMLGSCSGLLHITFKLQHSTSCVEMVSDKTSWVDHFKPGWRTENPWEARFVDSQRTECNHYTKPCVRSPLPPAHFRLHTVGVWIIQWKTKGQMLSFQHGLPSF